MWRKADARDSLGRSENGKRVATDWDKFVVPPEDDATPGSPESSWSKSDSGLPELVVTLEVLLDVRDIARLDMAELWPLKRALSRVDRDASVTSWAVDEPAPITEWRAGVARRASSSDVAGAILHALEPYHALMRRAQGGEPGVPVHLSIDRVMPIRRNAVMLAWFEQIKQVVGRDGAEREAWLRYWIAVNASTGTREDTARWHRGVRARAAAGSEVARSVLDSVTVRDRTMAQLDSITDPIDSVVDVPGITMS